LTNAIETRALSKRFGETLAVAGLSLTVRSGEVFGFLGPNGAGKTTSIKMLLALVAPTSGAGTLLGAPLGDRETRRRVGFLPEHFRFHDTLTGRELLRFHGRLYGRRGHALESTIDLLLERVDLLDAADRPIGGYSKGMLQRIGLAQALVNDPELVFLDEPTSGLDPLGRLLVRDIIGDLRARGTTVFLNSHLLSEVEATCDRVAFVRKGVVVQETTLKEKAALEAVAVSIEVELRVAPIDEGLLQDLSAFGRDVARTGEDGVRLRVDGEAVLPSIVRWLVDRGVRVYGVQARQPTLEERFVAIMGEERPG
jgi:ABC-2 type transport system ATP-binding protein